MWNHDSHFKSSKENLKLNKSILLLISNVLTFWYAISIWAGSSEKGAYGFSDVMRTNDVDDLIYDVTHENVKHATWTFKQNTVTFI